MSDDEPLFVDDYRVKRLVQTAASTLNNEHTQDKIKREIKSRVKDILLICSAMDSSNETIDREVMLEMMEQAFWIGRYAPAGPLAAFIEANNQSQRAKRPRKIGASDEHGWRNITRKLAVQLAAGGKKYSANGLAEAVIASWGSQKPNCPSSKTMACFVAKLAKEPSSPFTLLIDGRAKKLRKSAAKFRT